MNPEEIQELMQEVLALRARGVSDREINAAFRRYKVPVENVDTLERIVTNLGVSVAPAEPPSELRDVGRFTPLIDKLRTGQMAARRGLQQGLSGSFASDIRAGLEGVGALPEGSAEQFREGLAQSREDHPFVTGAGHIAGAVAGAPRMLATQGLIPAGRAASRLAARGAGRIAERAGVQPLGQLAAEGATRGVAGPVAGGLLGGAEGAAMAYGERAGEEDRMPGLLDPLVLLSAATGGVGGGIGTGVGQMRRTSQALRERGGVLAEQTQAAGRQLPTRRGIQAQVNEADAIRTEAFRKFDEAGQALPGEVTDFIIENPAARRVLAKSESQQARELSSAIKRFRAGEAKTVPSVPARLADQIRKELNDVGDAFKKRRPGASGKVPRGTDVDEAARAAETLTDLLGQVPGFKEGITATRNAHGLRRAAELGRSVSRSGVGSDVVEDLIQGKRISVLGPGRNPVAIPKVPGADEAFRAGLLRPELIRLRGGTKSIDTFLDRMRGPELQEKMRVALGGEVNYQNFLREADRARALGDAGMVMQAAIKFGGFSLLGSSVLAGGLGKLIGR